MKLAEAVFHDKPLNFSVRQRLNPRPLIALFVLTVRQHVRGRRLLALSALFLLPGVLAALVRLAPHAPPPEMLEFAFVFNLIPHALAPLTALLYAAGIIQDEVEEQTLTYLLLRPLPRWALYLTKLAATVLVTTVLTGVFTALTYTVIWWGTPELWSQVFIVRAAKTVALLALAQTAYCALFGALSLFTRRSLIAGLAYIVLVEGIVANFDFMVRRLTVIYWFRLLAAHWLELPASRQWRLDLTKAPSAGECVWTLLSASAVLALVGALLTWQREFRMKTPEGS